MSDTFYLRWHLGLGDAIICNGLVRELSKRHTSLLLPCKLPNFASVLWQFSDLVNVYVLPIRDDAEALALSKQYPTLGLGMWCKTGLRDRAHWDRQFYEDADVPFDCRWSSFFVPPMLAQLNPPPLPFTFVHQQPEQGRAFRQLPPGTLHSPPRPPHIFWHCATLAAAASIHVVNSCFLNLAESVATTGTLYLHNYARTDTPPPTLRKAWHVLD
jgi:hypothetical protein